MRQSISIFIFASLVFILQSQQIHIHKLEKYGSIKIDKSSDFEVIALDVSDFDPGDKVYLKITYEAKIKALAFSYKFNDIQGDMYNSHLELGNTYPLTFKKPGTSDFYFKIEKPQNYHYLNILLGSDYALKFENTKINEGLLHFIIIIFLIIIGTSGVTSLIVLLFKKCYFGKKLKENENKLARDQPSFKLVSVRNNEQQRVETNKNEARLSLNNNINKNNINIIPTIQNTENEIIPSNENFQEKK